MEHAWPGMQMSFRSFWSKRGSSQSIKRQVKPTVESFNLVGEWYLAC